MTTDEPRPVTTDDDMRTCYRGVLTLEEAQARIDAACAGFRVLELRPARCLSDDPSSNQLVPATEVIFARRSA